MSAPHRTALAKLRCVIEWLSHALGGANSTESSQSECVGWRAFGSEWLVVRVLDWDI